MSEISIFSMSKFSIWT